MLICARSINQIYGQYSCHRLQANLINRLHLRSRLWLAKCKKFRHAANEPGTEQNRENVDRPIVCDRATGMPMAGSRPAVVNPTDG